MFWEKLHVIHFDTLDFGFWLVFLSVRIHQWVTKSIQWVEMSSLKLKYKYPCRDRNSEEGTPTLLSVYRSQSLQSQHFPSPWFLHGYMKLNPEQWLWLQILEYWRKS